MIKELFFVKRKKKPVNPEENFLSKNAGQSN
jgi:hypothetical protein